MSQPWPLCARKRWRARQNGIGITGRRSTWTLEVAYDAPQGDHTGELAHFTSPLYATGGEFRDLQARLNRGWVSRESPETGPGKRWLMPNNTLELARNLDPFKVDNLG